MGASKTQVMNLLELRYDYQSARNVLVNWRKAAGIKEDVDSLDDVQLRCLLAYLKDNAAEAKRVHDAIERLILTDNGDAPAVEAAPAIEAVAVEEAPAIEAVAVEEAPVIEAVAVEEAPAIEAVATEEAPADAAEEAPADAAEEAPADAAPAEGGKKKKNKKR